MLPPSVFYILLPVHPPFPSTLSSPISLGMGGGGPYDYNL